MLPRTNTVRGGPMHFLSNDKRIGRYHNTHVDDFWMCGNHSFFEAVVDKISHIFDVGKLEDLPHKYLGLNLNTTDTGGLKLDLDHYKAKIAEMEGFGRNKNLDLLNSQQVKELRTLIGKLMWPAMHVKPEICFTLSYLASQLPYPTVELIKIANKVVRHVLNGPPIVLNFQALKNWSNISIISFTDASFNNNVDGSTHGGHLIFAMETDTLKCCLISWKSGKIRRIARSTLAAETFAMIDGINAAVFCRNLMAEVVGAAPNIHCFTDSKSLVEAIFSSNAISDRRLRVDVAFIRSTVAESFFKQFSWIRTDKQLADCLTKRKSSSTDLLCRVLASGSLEPALGDVWKKQIEPRCNPEDEKQTY